MRSASAKLSAELVKDERKFYKSDDYNSSRISCYENLYTVFENEIALPLVTREGEKSRKERKQKSERGGEKLNNV
jgi:hypothetical protein